MKRKIMTLLLTIVLTLSLIVPTNVSAEKLSLNKKSVTLEIDNTFKLKLGKIKATDITWWSSNKSIATVSKWGTVTAKSEGTAKITAKYKNKKYICTIKIEDYSDWVLYDTSNVKNLVDLILRGHVISIDGKYYCSPEYVKMIENENIVYEHDVSTGSDNFEFSLTPDAEFEFENNDDKDKAAKEKELQDRINEMLNNGTSHSK